jgi:hypothetical protein
VKASRVLGVQASFLDEQVATLLETPLERPISLGFNDQYCLRALLQIHAPPDADIVDVCHNQGAMWVGLGARVHRLDKDPQLLADGLIDAVADWSRLPLDDASWDVVVFDPPHLTDTTEWTLRAKVARGQRRQTDWQTRYGLGTSGTKGKSIAPGFAPFLVEAMRVLKDHGIVLAKICNMVHSAQYQDQARAFKNTAEALGFRHCDEMVRASFERGRLLDPKWKHVYHVRGVHTYWIVLRKGNRCHLVAS